MSEPTAAQLHLAWLMWCCQEGFVKAEDRGRNWMLEDPEKQHPDDRETRERLLEMAGEVLKELTLEELPIDERDRIVARVMKFLVDRGYKITFPTAEVRPIISNWGSLNTTQGTW